MVSKKLQIWYDIQKAKVLEVRTQRSQLSCRDVQVATINLLPHKGWATLSIGLRGLHIHQKKISESSDTANYSVISLQNILGCMGLNFPQSYKLLDIGIKFVMGLKFKMMDPGWIVKTQKFSIFILTFISFAEDSTVSLVGTVPWILWDPDTLGTHWWHRPIYICGKRELETPFSWQACQIFTGNGEFCEICGKFQ